MMKALLLWRFWRDENGATAVEYGLIAALVALVVVGSTTAVGTNLKGKFNNIANAAK
jgi:pilus assembly protein Flp/PilA